ncbi:hypothetical protein BpHYR1_000027 [Brachionus plicatilis]|uniref:Uncharacterized protein n=1 Tax=Brachionus plicatilis TaxID=10195 RepID=A0A3M7QJI2_BRAPC|nr:hypothetical protein BpHYR1_000027 [Brachionus plicatilis]
MGERKFLVGPVLGDLLDFGFDVALLHCRYANVLDFFLVGQQARFHYVAQFELVVFDVDGMFGDVGYAVPVPLFHGFVVFKCLPSKKRYLSLNNDNYHLCFFFNILTSPNYQKSNIKSCIKKKIFNQNLVKNDYFEKLGEQELMHLIKTQNESFENEFQRLDYDSELVSCTEAEQIEWLQNFQNSGKT